MLTHVRAFAVKSVAIGGDSAVDVKAGCLAVGPERRGPPMCLGGSVPTPTDALRVLGKSSLGDLERAMEAMAGLAGKMSCSIETAAAMVVDFVVEKIAAEINEMFREWEQEPAYRIWEIMKKEKLQAQNVVGVGGGSGALVPLVASRLGVASIVPEHAAVANAIGAAVARPTITLNLHIDTERGEYVTAEDGIMGKVNERQMSLSQAEQLAGRLLTERAARLGIGEYAAEAEITSSEVFNMIRGWSTVGKLLDVRMEIPAGLLPSWRCS